MNSGLVSYATCLAAFVAMFAGWPIGKALSQFPDPKEFCEAKSSIAKSYVEDRDGGVKMSEQTRRIMEYERIPPDYLPMSFRYHVAQQVYANRYMNAEEAQKLIFKQCIDSIGR